MLNTKFFNIRLYLEGLKRLKVIGMAVAILSLSISALIPIVDWMETPWDYDKINTVEQNVICVPLYFVIFLAPLFFLVLFSFLHKRRESDFFHAIPYTRTCVYFSFVASALTFVFAIMIASASVAGLLWGLHPFATFKLGELIAVTLMCMLAAAMLSSFMMLALTLTGTPTTTTLMFLLFTLFVRLILFYMSTCIDYQVDVIDVSNLPFFKFSWFLPFGMAAFAINGVGYYNFNPIKSVPCILYSLVVTVLIFTAAWFFYKRRKSEMAGNTAPNRMTQHIFRILFTLPFVLLIPMAFMTEDMDFTIFLVLVVVTLLVYYLYELITTKRFQGFGKATALLPVLVGCCLLFACAFACIQAVIFETSPDDSDEVASVYIDASSGYSTGWDDYQRYLLQDCSSSDRELIGKFVENLATSIDADSRNQNDVFGNGIDYRWFTVEFTLQNGRTVTREVAIKESDRNGIIKKYVDTIDVDTEMIWSMPDLKCVNHIYCEMVIEEIEYYCFDFHDTPTAEFNNFYRMLLKEYNALSTEQKQQLRRAARHGLDSDKGTSIYLGINGTFPTGDSLPGYRGNYFSIALDIDKKLMPETFDYLMKHVPDKYADYRE